jgi:hypothetical protein
MKAKVTPTGFQCDENFIVDLHELFTLLIGKDFTSRQAFRKDVLERAAEIRMRQRDGNVTHGRNSKIIRFPMGYPCPACMKMA